MEYIVRWIVSDKKLKYPFTLSAVIDLLAILPFFLTLFPWLTTLRFFRIFRMLRLLKILKYINLYIWFKTQIDKRNIGPISRNIIIVIILWFFGALILFLTSGGYDSFWDSLWNVIIIIMSGMDVEGPKSAWGKVEVVFLMFIGILLIGFITGEIISGLMEKEKRRGKVDLLPLNTKLSEHIIIINQNKQLYNIVEQINGAYNDKHYIVLASEGIKDFEIHNKKLSKKVLGMDGDILKENNLERLNLEKALGVIILTPEDDENRGVMTSLAVINKLRKIKENVNKKEDGNGLDKKFKLVIEVRKEERYRDYNNILTRLDEVKDSIFLFHSNDFVDKLITQAVVNPHSSNVYDELMTYSDDSNEFYRECISEKMKYFTLKEIQEKFFDENIIFVAVEDSYGKILIPDFNEKLVNYKAVFFITYNYEDGFLEKVLSEV
jgi:voltage-gated potassium channel